MTPLRRLLTALLVLAAPAALAQTDLIVDGSFERGTTDPAWTVTTSSGTTPLCTEAQCGPPSRTGDWFAFLGALGVDNDMSVEQTVTIPANATTAVLTYYLQLGAGEDGTGEFGLFIDTIQLETFDQDDATLFPDYVVRTVDLSTFADGQPHRIRFVGVEVAGTVDGAFFGALVDDVSLVITGSGGLAPFNDVYLTAYSTDGSQTVYNDTNVGATAEDGFNPSASCTVGTPENDGDNSVWRYVRAASTGTLTVDLEGSDFDTILAVFDDAGEIACNDDDPGTPGDATSRVEASVTEGNLYLIRVTGYQGASGAIQMTITGDPYGPGPSGDSVSPAMQLGVGLMHPESNVGATAEAGEPAPTCTSLSTTNSIWRSFIAPVSGSVTIDTETSTFDTVLDVWDAGGFAGTELSCNDDIDGAVNRQSRVTLDVTEGAAYFVRVTGFDGAEGGIAINVSDVVATASDPAPNDDLFALAPIAPNPVVSRATVSVSLAEPGDVRVEAFDVLGRSVALLHEGPLAAGDHRLTWTPRGLPAGTYVVRATAHDAVRTQTVTVVR